MKVYLVHCEYNDLEEDAIGDILLNIYDSMDKALEARKGFVNQEINVCIERGYEYCTSIDCNNDPVVSKIAGEQIIEECTFTIEEWLVN